MQNNGVLYVRICTERTLPVVTCGCESWTMQTPDESRTETFKMKVLRRVLSVSWTTKQGNVSRNLLSNIKTRKLVYFSHVAWHNCLGKDVIPGKYLESGTGNQRRRPKIRWFNNVWRKINLERKVYCEQQITELNGEIHYCS